MISSKGALTQYGVYTMTWKEKIGYTLCAVLVIFAAAFLFYRSSVLSLLLMPAALFYPRLKTRDLLEKRKKELTIQFKDMLYSLSSSLTAGKSIETAFREVLKDLNVLYPDPRTDIVREVGTIIRRLEMNETVEAAFLDFSSRAGIEDIANFTDVFITCKRTGGNVVEVIKNTSGIISDKIEIGQEIDTLLAQRKFEQKVLNVLPVFMILLLSFTAGDYIQPVFETGTGRIVMTASIGLLVIAYLLSRRITDIRV